MTNMEIIISALALAFCWVEILNQIKSKPFNCMKCMSGYFSFVIAGLNDNYMNAFSAHAPFWVVKILLMIIFIAVGVFAGALFEGIKMRWL
jgi:cell division protein FtsX